MSLGLLGKTGPEVLAHRPELLLDLTSSGLVSKYRSVTLLLMLINRQMV